MAEPIPNAYQDVMEHLAKRAEDPDHGDCFKLKVLRRPNASTQVTQYVATFTDATFSMITNAESWLAPFAGGGLYVLHVFDGKGKRHHATLTPSEIVGAARAPDPRVTKTSTWLGPTLIDAPIAAGNGAMAIGSQTLTLAGDPQLSGVPPRSDAAAGVAGLFDGQRAMNEEVRRREAELTEERRKLESERHKNEMDAIRRSNEEARRASEDRLRALEARLSEPKQSIDLVGIMTGVAGLLAPVITAWVSSSAADRQRQIELEKARLDAEMRRAEEAGKPKPLVDPQLLEILNGQSKRAEDTARQFGELMKAQADAARLNMEGQGVAQRSMFQTIAQMMELQAKVGEPPEAPGIDWAKVGMGLLQGLAAMQARAQGAPGAPQAPGGIPGSSQPALNGMAPPQAAPEAPPIVPSEAFNVVEKMIRQKTPPSEVIDQLKLAMADEEAKKEIEASGGILGVFDERLAAWSEHEENGPYLAALQKALIESKILMFE
jgi:hypothetical protein